MKAKEKVKALFEGDETYSTVEINDQFKNVEKTIVRTQILKDAKRIDKRKLNEVRDIKCEVGVLPKVHGSCIVYKRRNTSISGDYFRNIR